MMRFLIINCRLPPVAGFSILRTYEKTRLTRLEDSRRRHRHVVARERKLKQSMCCTFFRRIVEDQSKKIPSFDGCGATSIAKYLIYHRPSLSKTLGEAVVEYAAAVSHQLVFCDTSDLLEKDPSDRRERSAQIADFRQLISRIC